MPPGDLDYAALGFRCGLEIHQQLATSKLFCRCPTDPPELDDERAEQRFVRRLRLTQSEMGEVDAAALAEAQRGRLHEYRGFRAYSCLVDADEEPPHAASPAAVEVALTCSLVLGSRPLDEVQWMRKIVIDGSNTTGFQRTGLLAQGGQLDGVRIQSVCLEEDSARRIRDEKDRVVWGLERLGIPLIEIATDPTLRDGAHARAVAARIGALLRSTGRVRRGLGTIRQDLNVSIRDGTRVEIKGVQDLASIPKVIDWEVRRQLRLAQIARSLGERRVTEAMLAWSPQDLSEVFRGTGAKFLRKTLDEGGVVVGLRLPGFHGLIGSERKEDPRLGRELGAYAKRDGGVQGILHGDELPGLGISAPEVESVRQRLACGPQDSFVLVAESKAKAEPALRVVHRRAVQALRGVPSEVRMAEADQTNSYLRPMPGAARMYPETDVPPTPVTDAMLAHLRERLPAPPEQQIEALSRRFGLGLQEATQVFQDDLAPELERLASNGDASLAARALLAYWPDLRQRHPASAPRLPQWTAEALAAVRAGRFAKEGLPTVLEALASGRATSVEEALAATGLGAVDKAELEARAKAIVAERQDFVRSRGLESVGPLMGVLMKEFRGRVDGREISDVLRREVERALATR